MRLCIIVIIVSATIASHGVQAITPALYVFGDSTVDVGNNNFLSATAPKANFPYYGIDYCGGVPTGRFSNGYNAADFIAKAMGNSMSPAAFLSVTNYIQTLEGVNFASAGSGILDTTNPATLSMNKQVMDFEKVAQNLTATLGNSKADAFLSKSVFLFSTGSNDMFAHFRAFGAQNDTQKDQFVSFLSSNFKAQLTMLHELGARKFAVSSTATIGCIPSARVLNSSGGCVQDLNDISQRYLIATKALLQELSSSLTGMLYSFADAFKITAAITAKPLEFGFKELIAACCGTGKLNAGSDCTPNATYCSNRDDHIFWDRNHLTQAAAQLLVEFALHGPPEMVSPINFNQLINSSKMSEGPCLRFVPKKVSIHVSR